MQFFFPSSFTFPSISTTGAECRLDCMHCRRHYLKTMIDASKIGLYDTCVSVQKKGAFGALISGGSDENGTVIIDNAQLEQVNKIKGFVTNVHSGLIEDEIPAVLKEVDVISIDIPPSDAAINNVIGLQKKQDNYFDTLEKFEELKIKYAPHICIGLENGEVKGEYQTLERLESYNFSDLVLLTLKRTPNAPMTKNTPNIQECESVIKFAREKFKSITLGCMRERSRKKEKLWHYFDKIAWPSTIIKEEVLRADIACTIKKVCCSV